MTKILSNPGAGVSPIVGGTIAQPANNRTVITPDFAGGMKDLGRTYVASLPAGGATTINAAGDFLFIRSLSAASFATVGTGSALLALRIKPDNSPALILDRPGQYYRFPRSFSSVEISNPAGNLSLAVEIFFGFGNYEEPREHRVAPFFAERTITRPANTTAYAANQYVGTMPDLGGKGMVFQNVFRVGSRLSRITRAMIRKGSAQLGNAAFSLWLFQTVTSPFAAGTDQTTFAMTTANDNPAMGRISFPSFATGGAGSDMAICDLAGIDVPLRQLDGNSGETSIFGILVADAAYVPTSGEYLTISLWGEQLG
jgi:hypothetical protein